MKTQTNNSNILSQYQTKGTIGKGTFGKVKLGINKATNEKVAIKILEKSKITSQDDMDRINREINILRNFSNLNVIKIYDIFETKENFYIIMEYCEKGELFNYIVYKQRLPEDEASYFYYQLINGLEYIHSHNVVHRDLKPENLLLEKGNILKIIDFGLSNYYHGQFLSTPCGSPCYASPEMVSGNKYNGFCIDIWSTGIILYAMICGYLPFEDPNNEILFKKILECKLQYPRHVSSLVKSLMKKILVTEPKNRITIEQIKKHPFYLKGEAIFKEKHPDLYLSMGNKTSLTSSIIETDVTKITNTKPINKRKPNIEIPYNNFSIPSGKSDEDKNSNLISEPIRYHGIKTEYEIEPSSKISAKIGCFFKSTVNPKNPIIDFTKSSSGTKVTTTTPLLMDNNNKVKVDYISTSIVSSTSKDPKKSYSKASTFNSAGTTRLNTEHELSDRYLHTSTNLGTTTKNNIIPTNFPNTRRINTSVQKNDYNSFRGSHYSNLSSNTKKDSKLSYYTNGTINPTKILFNYNNTPMSSRLDYPQSPSHNISSHVTSTSSSIKPISSTKPIINSYVSPQNYNINNYDHQIKGPNSITINNPTITVYNLGQNIFCNSPNTNINSHAPQLSTPNNITGTKVKCTNLFKTKKELANPLFNSLTKKNDNYKSEGLRFHSSNKPQNSLADKYLSTVLGNSQITSNRIKEKLKIDFYNDNYTNKNNYSSFNSGFDDKQMYIKTDNTNSYEIQSNKIGNTLKSSHTSFQPKRYMSGTQKGTNSKIGDSHRDIYNLRLSKLKSQANNMGRK